MKKESNKIDSQGRGAGELFRDFEEELIFSTTNPSDILTVVKFTGALTNCLSGQFNQRMTAEVETTLKFTLHSDAGERVAHQSIEELLNHQNPEQLAQNLHNKHLADQGIIDPKLRKKIELLRSEIDKLKDDHGESQLHFFIDVIEQGLTDQHPNIPVAITLLTGLPNIGKIDSITTEIREIIKSGPHKHAEPF